jgi:hypothetical protein
MGKGRVRERREGYRQYVKGAAREGLKESPWEALAAQIVLGAKRRSSLGRQEPIFELSGSQLGTLGSTVWLRSLNQGRGFLGVSFAAERVLTIVRTLVSA